MGQNSTFHKLVQINSVSELDTETREFLESHAIRPLEEIDLVDTNDFLRACYYRSID